MSLLHQLRSERLQSEVPVVKVFEKSKGMKIIGIALKNNVDLKEHKTSLESRLVVIEGSVEYKEASKSIIMHCFDEIEIPVNETHALHAKEDSLCLLIQKTND